MKEIRAIGLIPFHQSIMKLCIQRLLLLQSKTPSYALPYERRGVSIFFAFAILISSFNFISNYL